MSSESSNVVQARNEQAESERLGATESVRAARKRLAAAGIDPDAEVKKAAEKRREAAVRERAARPSSTDRPAGRQARPHSTT